jgi:hypothetical protein
MIRQILLNNNEIYYSNFSPTFSRSEHTLKYLFLLSPSGSFAQGKILSSSSGRKSKSCDGSLSSKPALPDPAVLGADLVEGVTVGPAAETEVAQEADGSRRSDRWWRGPCATTGAGAAGGEKAWPDGSAGGGCRMAHPPPPSLPLSFCQHEATRMRAGVRPEARGGTQERWIGRHRLLPP